jgi:Nif-specific regulatory protein/two-component system response regulator HydG
VIDARSEILRLCREATSSLQRLEAASSPRAWAQEHFAALLAIERAAARAGPSPAPRPDGDDVHAALLRALREFFAAAAGDDDPVGAALDALMRIAGARRGFFAVRQADGALAFPSARSFSEVELGRPEVEVSRTILEAAIRGGAHPLAIDDARADARFAGTTSVQRLAVRSVLAVPLVDEGRAYGVVYLDSPGEAAAFDPRRREAVGAFAVAVASPLRAALTREPMSAARPPGGRLAQLRRAHDLAGLYGEGPALTVVAERLLAVAPTDAPALICGETGVGKELVAALLHRNSRRAAGPRVTLRCAGAAAAGLRAALDEARGGTLILDEIDALAPAQQGALVAELDAERAREGGARVLALSRRGHRALAADGALRPELLYRVCVVEIEVPPLRERARDIEAIARGVLAARPGGAPRRLRREALARLELYPWPGNVRELENVLASASLSAADDIGVEHLPAHLRDHEPVAASSGAGLKEAVRAFRRRFVEQAMSAAGADHKQAAAALGVHPKYLFKLLRELRDDE